MKRITVVILFLFLAAGICFASDELVPNSDMERAVLADWKKQEAEKGRTIADAASLAELHASGTKLLAALQDEELITDERNASLAEALKDCAPEKIDDSGVARSAAYLKLRREIRAAALENSLVAEKPILFHKGDRFVCQMLHEYMSYYAYYTNRSGGGLFRLKTPGKSFEIEPLTDGKFPTGVFSTPSLSFDGETVYFAFADFSRRPPLGPDVISTGAFRDAQNGLGDGTVKHYADYMSSPEGKHHLYKMKIDGGEPVRLTDGCDDDFDPAEIPGGDLVFMSTRRGGFGRCHGTWEPLAVHTLHRLAQDGKVTTLSWHETNEWQPSVLPDGRILYTRWDYVDRSASRHHGLWITNPDGTGALSLFGNYTFQINACYQAKTIPDSKKILFVPGAHHLDVGGPLAILDPTLVRYDSEISEDTLDAVENMTPEIPFPEAPNQCPPHYYFSPWPLSEDFYLTAYSHDSLGGMLSSEVPETTGRCGLYYRDRFGILELLYEDPSISCQYPIPIAAREMPPQIPSQLPPQEKRPETATLFLSNVNESLTPLPADRPIRELRVFQILPKYPDHRSDSPKVGYANAQNARVYLGSIPIEKDGSAYFRVPAKKPLYFQAVDEAGRAVQSMRSEVYLQPGENRGCVGCHEQAQTAFKNEPGFSDAFKRGPSELKPGPDGSAPFSYPRLVQPVLDTACVSCHKAEGSAAPILTGEIAGHYTASYENLRPFVRWYEWGGGTYREISTLPGQCGADISPLSAILNDEHHGEKIKLSDEQRRTLFLWLDANAPFYGDTDHGVQEKQQKGEKVGPPALE